MKKLEELKKVFGEGGIENSNLHLLTDKIKGGRVQSSTYSSGSTCDCTSVCYPCNISPGPKAGSR